MHRRFLRKKCGMWVFLIISVSGVHGQSFEISPLVGGRFGGSLKLEQPGQPNFHADLADSLSYGIAGGYRFDAEDCVRCSVIGFRWMRQDTHLEIPGIRPSVTLNHFLGDFTREWPLEEANAVRPFINATLGAVRMSAPASSATRFVFGFGTGLKIFPAQHWGVQVHVEWLPIALQTELQRIVCNGGCIVALNGGITNQFVVSVGPVFRFGPL
jgi:hypothetical protein